MTKNEQLYEDHLSNKGTIKIKYVEPEEKTGHVLLSFYSFLFSNGILPRELL